eukprot:XP_011453326.2 PREDICTED: THAP domain-containing protein 4 [Crassostrea gigas]
MLYAYTEMVKCCCVYKCRNVCNSEARANGVSFFRFPKDKWKRRAWTNAVNRDKWTPNEHSWICSDHVVEGWHGDDLGDENYAPTLFFYKKKRTEDDFDREPRRLDRETIRERLCSEKVNMEREKAHLELSVLVHGSYCKMDDSGDHDQDIAAAVPCAYHEITDDVDVPIMTCDSGKS